MKIDRVVNPNKNAQRLSRNPRGGLIPGPSQKKIITQDGPREGTGTWPDYLVNRVLTKNEGPHREKNVRKSRNIFEVKGKA